ncbi:MAG: alpha/beta fold hydrolase BchO [Pseudomonadota bacterium]
MRDNLAEKTTNPYQSLSGHKEFYDHDTLNWDVEGQDWPNRDHSEFIHAGGLRWHVQKMGHGPYILLIHGTGASTHSWRELAPLLATEFTVVAPDLPGHGFTNVNSSHDLSLQGMASALNSLKKEMGFSPCIVVGHSAGAAILTRMAIDKMICPRWLVSLNGAILPLGGLPGVIFAPLARLFALSSFGSRFFTWRAADEQVVKRLLSGTGSHIDDRGMELYMKLFRNPSHVSATLNMMANWDLHSLRKDLPFLESTLTSIVGMKDKTIPPIDAERLCRIVHKSKYYQLDELGHLAHEEDPKAVAQIISHLVRKAE